jgi:hypothetical protein
VAESPKYKPIGQNYVRTPATPSMIVASLDAGKRVDEGLVTHV